MNVRIGSAFVAGTTRVWDGLQWQPARAPAYEIRDGSIFREGAVVGRALSVSFAGDGTVNASYSAPKYSIDGHTIYRNGIKIGRVLSISFPGDGTITISPSAPDYSIAGGVVYRDGTAIGRQLPVGFNGDGSIAAGTPSNAPPSFATFDRGVHDSEHEVYL